MSKTEDPRPEGDAQAGEEVTDSELFGRLAQLSLHKLAAFQAGDAAAGEDFFEISAAVTRAFARRAAALEAGQLGQFEAHSHSAQADRTIEALLQIQAELDARDPARRSARAEALRILARSPQLC